MEDKYREHIIGNVDRLVKLTDYKKLCDACLQLGLLTNIMVQQINEVTLDSLNEDQLMEERHKRLFRKITKRGPDAYNTLKQLLIDMEFDGAVQLLNKILDDDSKFTSLAQQHQLNRIKQISNKIQKKPYKFEPYTQEIKPEFAYEIIKSKSICTNSNLPVYPMDSKDNRGVFVMVNIIDFSVAERRRNGAEKDGESLKYLFRNLGFTLFAYENLSQSEFFELLDTVMQSEYTRKTQCFVLVLMTHGDLDAGGCQRVEFHGGSIVKVDEIEKRFYNDYCPNLVGKPKILLFPFCRGDIPDRGQTTQTEGIGKEPKILRPDTFRLIHTISDVIICYASSLGFETIRDAESGSWYIQTFCKLMAKHAHNTNFEDIVKLVQSEAGTLRSTRGDRQMGNYVNMGFNKNLFFNPGVWSSE